MSRVGKKPIPIPAKVKVDIDNKHVTVTGPKGTLEREIHPEMTAAIEDNQVVVTRPSDQKKHCALHGLTRALINNMVEGVSEGFKKELLVIGVGYRIEMKGSNLQLHLGYSHPVVFAPPEDVAININPKENRISIEGIDKQLVGQVAAKIRSFRKPEPYKGKGVRYVGEYVKIKPGKTASSGA